MFTGLIETTGKVIKMESVDSGIQFSILTKWQNPDLKKGDSIAISGACMTVTDFKEEGNEFSFYTSYKSLELTNLSNLQLGNIVNLERAMAVNQRFGGHLVQGHVDGVGVLQSIKKIETGVFEFWIQIPETLAAYFVKKGSVTVDGISLTVVDVKEGSIQLVLIPETMEKTNAHIWKEGQKLNLEVDILAKYVENFLRLRTSE
ncbi:riboflavin synthase [Leptospira sp. 96542]|nr:riboflavin synthase [Leptospira sp. 96542]